MIFAMAVLSSNNQRRKSAANDSERIEWERRIKMQVVGFLLLPLSIFPLLSLLTYDWRDISWLHSPPLSPVSNWIGPVGAWSVFVGYSFIGIALWAVPFFVILFGLLLITRRMNCALLKLLWVSLFVVALACVLQLGSEGMFKDLIRALNISPNAGGMAGYWIMTRALTRWISPVGSGILMLCLMIFAMYMIIGTSNFVSLVMWVADRFSTQNGEADGEFVVSASKDGSVKDKEATREAAKAAAAAAKAARREEREEQRRLKKEAAEEERRRRDELREAKKQEKIRVKEESRKVGQMSEIERIRLQADRVRRAAMEAQLMERTAGAKTPSVPAKPAPVKSVAESPSAAAVTTTKRDAGNVAKQSVAPEKEAKSEVNYMLPPVDLLDPLPSDKADHGSVEDTANDLVTALNHFKIPAEVVGIKPGPVVTQYEIQPAPHIRVERIVNLTNNLKMSLAAASLRVEAPIPGKKAVGIEIPNKKARSVTFRSIVESEEWQKNRMNIPLALGKLVSGENFVYDLTKAPHMLVAGSTGSGKSVCLNAFLCGILMSRTPEQLKLILIDPKRVEFVAYNDLPHLLVPVINDPNKVVFGLKWALSEMDKRYRLLQKVRARNIVDYNNRPVVRETDLFDGDVDDNSGDPEKLPYIVIVIDEVADIMSAAGKEVEPVINRLCALSRAVGIHMILATQRPSVDVITGTIKANIPGRIAFKVSQSNDSRTILDSPGAENLIGSGDMLFLQSGSDLLRVQGAWVTPLEVNRIVSYVKERHAPIYDEKLSNRLEKIKEADPEDIMNEDEDVVETESKAAVQQEKRESELEELYNDAIEMIRVHKRVSGELVRRKLKVGYSRANTILDMLEERGIVSPLSDTNTREILMDLNQPAPGTQLTGDALDYAEDGNFEDEIEEE